VIVIETEIVVALHLARAVPATLSRGAQRPARRAVRPEAHPLATATAKVTVPDPHPVEADRGALIPDPDQGAPGHRPVRTRARPTGPRPALPGPLLRLLPCRRTHSPAMSPCAPSANSSNSGKRGPTSHPPRLLALLSRSAKPARNSQGRSRTKPSTHPNLVGHHHPLRLPRTTHLDRCRFSVLIVITTEARSASN
jgi:hypothetical protein